MDGKTAQETGICISYSRHNFPVDEAPRGALRRIFRSPGCPPTKKPHPPKETGLAMSQGREKTGLPLNGRGSDLGRWKGSLHAPNGCLCPAITGRNRRFSEHVWNGSSRRSLAARIDSFEISKDIFYLTSEPVEDGAHVLDPFDHPFPFELDAVGVVNDVPEATVRLHL